MRISLWKDGWDSPMTPDMELALNVFFPVFRRGGVGNTVSTVELTNYDDGVLVELIWYEYPMPEYVVNLVQMVNEVGYFTVKKTVTQPYGMGAWKTYFWLSYLPPSYNMVSSE